MSYFHSLRKKTYAELAREQKADLKQREAEYRHFREDEILAANPHIGVLIRKGKRVFYTGAGENVTARIEDLL